MRYLQQNLRRLFPFRVTGGSSIKSGEYLSLHPLGSLPTGSGQVKVSRVSPTSFTFTVSSGGYFDPKGSTITFSTISEKGMTYLQEHADAPQLNPFNNLMAPEFAKSTWSGLADNINGLQPPCHQNAAQALLSYIAESLIC